jgi:hypothetical protein
MTNSERKRLKRAKLLKKAKNILKNNVSTKFTRGATINKTFVNLVSKNTREAFEKKRKKLSKLQATKEEGNRHTLFEVKKKQDA